MQPVKRVRRLDAARRAAAYALAACNRLLYERTLLMLLLLMGVGLGGRLGYIAWR